MALLWDEDLKVSLETKKKKNFCNDFDPVSLNQMHMWEETSK